MRLLCTPHRRACSVPCWVLVTQQLTSSSSEAVTNSLYKLLPISMPHWDLPVPCAHTEEVLGKPSCCRGPEAGQYLQVWHRARESRGTVHGYRMPFSSTGSPGKSVILPTCTCRPGCVLWSEDSPAKYPPTYSLISPCPIAPPQKHRQPQAQTKTLKPPTVRGMGEGVLSKCGRGEQNNADTDNLRLVQSAASCKMGQNLWISSRHCWTMQISSSSSCLPKGGQGSATFTTAKMTGQKSTPELSYKLITTIKLIASIILQTLLMQACHTPQKPAALPSLPQDVPCH